MPSLFRGSRPRDERRQRNMLGLRWPQLARTRGGAGAGAAISGGAPSRRVR